MSVTRWIIRGFAGISFISSLLFALQEFFRKPSKKEQGAGSESAGGAGGTDSAEPMEIDEGDPLVKRMRKVLEGDPLIRDRALQLAGERDRSLRYDARKVKEIAERIPEGVRNALYVASTQDEITFNLQSRKYREEVNYPTRDVDIVQVADPGQLVEVLPEEYALDDDMFMERLANGELRKLTFYEHRIEKKLLYILLDVSPSMNEIMHNGMPRHVWSRGIVANLLMKAVRGEAEYMLRPFDARVYPVERATTPQDAQKLLDRILGMGIGSGTNIAHAVQYAVSDIEKVLDATIEGADILLISDGEDESLSVQHLRNLLGERIRLHAILIGRRGTDGVISAVAKTYKEYA